jgi:8-oxo-dGTP pyrophosphatase MutT (NUDIX family)
LTTPSFDDVPVRDAATVALLRDAPGGLEVFMLKRSSSAVFSPSAYVFPGGALDDGDRDDAIAQWCAPFTPVDDEVPMAYYVAAIREAFEEAGLLLAHDRDGALVALDQPDVGERFALHRKAMHAGDVSIGTVCEDEGLALAVDVLVPFGHWITPKGAPRRFDTRFFATRVPARQHASPDEVETTDGRWTRPDDLVAANDAGDVELILPTRRSLERLARFDRVDDALAGLAVPR